MHFINRIDIPPPGQALKKIWQIIPRNIKITFTATFIIGMLVHGYMLANFFLQHDALSNFLAFLHGISPGNTIRSGRWLQETAIASRGLISAPWLLGIISLFYLSITSCIVSLCLETKRIYSGIMIGVLLATFPTTETIFSYMYVADNAFLCALLACLSAFLCKKLRFGFIIGGIIKNIM